MYILTLSVWLNSLRKIPSQVPPCCHKWQQFLLFLRLNHHNHTFSIFSLKLNIKKTKIVASRPITSWQIEGEKVEAGTDFLFLHSGVTADGDCSHEIRRRLRLGRKVMTNLDSMLKRDITLLAKVHIVKAMVFAVVMHGCESWTMKKAEHQRIDAFQLWCWRS